jgi:hypothetical protein
MKNILSFILLLNSIILFAQKKMNIDDAFIGIPSNTAISGLELDGRQLYKN